MLHEESALLVGVFFILVCSVCSKDFVESACQHSPTTKFRTGVFVESTHSVHRRSNSQPLRIHVEFSQEVDELPPEHLDLVKNQLLPTATEFLSERIQVRRPLTSPLVLYRDCNDNRTYNPDGEIHQFCWNDCHRITRCGTVTVPDNHLQACYACKENKDTCVRNPDIPAGQGIPDTDFILYVQVDNTIPCLTPDTTAHASYCQLESSLDRPIAGHINICPNALSTSEAHRSILLTTVKHEIIHALGFSSSLFAFYRDDKGNPLTERDASGLPPFNSEYYVYQWSERVIREVVRYDWDTRSGLVLHPVQMMVTPKVKEEARRHFNCASLEGIELENDGGLGTMFSHFEKRLLENEAMTGTHTHDRQFSRFTLAVLEDTGWYHVNYDLADNLSWGKNLGCDFVKKSCKTWMDMRRNSGRSLLPFCDSVQSNFFNFSCDSERTSLAMCNLKKYDKSIPVEYQYFNELKDVPENELSHYGGTSFLADYCPFNQQFSYTTEDGESKTSTCYLSSNTVSVGDNVAAEYYGPSSICINHGKPWLQEKCIHYDRQITWGAGCYQYFCSDLGLKIVIEGVNHLCTEEGQVIDVSVVSSDYRHQGTIICPPCSQFCDHCPTAASLNVMKEEGDEGQCPRLAEDTSGICIAECNDNQDCHRRQVCCYNGCGRVCVDPVKAYNTDIPCRAGMLISMRWFTYLLVVFLLLWR